MIYLGIVTPVLVALAGMYATLQKADTARWQRRVIPILALLTLVSGVYSVHATRTAKKTLEPWEATQAVYARTVDAWTLVNEAEQTKDSETLDRVIGEFSELGQDAMKSRAPSWFKARVSVLVIAVEIWALAERHPSVSPEEVVAMYAREHLRGTPFEGRPGKLLDTLGLFRVQDFGPPYRVLTKISDAGDLQVDETRLSKQFFLARARELLTDVMGMAQ